MDYTTKENDARTNVDHSETGGDFRVSYESEWADLDGPRKPYGTRVHYSKPQLQPNEDYSGILDCMSVDEARALFEEMLDRFHLYDWKGFPLPPIGLPGFAADACDDELPAKLIEIGLGYAVAAIRNERRAMHLRWQDAENFIRKIESETEIRIGTEEVKRAMAEYDRREATPVYVYFIGSENGPIKIGSAVNPAARLKGLQTGHHETLSIFATCGGGVKQERAYHKLFADRRLNGEWFERCPQIEAEIERLNRP